MRFRLGTGCPHSLPRPATRIARMLLTLALAAAVLPIAVPASAAPGDPVRFEQTDARITWSGIWTRVAVPGVSGGDHTFTNAPGATVKLAFVGTQIDLVGMIGPKCGIASVSLDGAAPMSVDAYAADSAFGQTLLSLPSLSSGLHTLTITSTGAKRAEAADAFVSLDAVVVSGDLASTPVDHTDTRIVRRGSWTTMTAGGPFGGSQILSNAAGNEVAVAFTGTQLALVGMTGPKFGIASVSVDGGAPVDVDLYSADTRFRQVIFTTAALAAGPHTVRLSTTGRKNAAAADAFVALDAVLPSGALAQATVRYEEADPRIAGNGDLHEEWAGSLSGGRYVWAGPSWGAVAVSFVGARFDWVGVTGPQFGIASVRIDGGAPQYVDLYAPGVTTKQTVYSTGEIAYGQHTVTISWTGRASQAATGTYIGFDAFDIGGELVQATPPARPAEALTFSYPWARYLVVDKGDFRIYLVEDGVCVKSYPIAVGALGMTTPNAYWRIDAKYYTDPTSVYGPRKMRMFRQSGNTYVYTAYGIHGTNNEASIGTRASHGCIRLYNRDVIELFDMVPLGTMVVTRD